MLATAVGLESDWDSDQGFQRGLRRGISSSKQLLKGCSAAFSGPFAVRSRQLALSGDGIAAGAIAPVGTLGAPRPLRARVLALASCETILAHTLPAHRVAPQRVGPVALACPGTAGSEGEGCAWEVAESAVAGGRTLAVAETSVTTAARAVVGTQALAPVTETSVRTHVVTAMLAVSVGRTAAAACLVIAQCRCVAKAFLLAVNAEHTLGTLGVAKISDVSWLTATYFGAGITRAVFACTTRVLTLLTEQPRRTLSQFASPAVFGEL